LKDGGPDGAQGLLELAEQGLVDIAALVERYRLIEVVDNASPVKKDGAGGGEVAAGEEDIGGGENLVGNREIGERVVCRDALQERKDDEERRDHNPQLGHEVGHLGDLTVVARNNLLGQRRDSKRKKKKK